MDSATLPTDGVSAPRGRIRRVPLAQLSADPDRVAGVVRKVVSPRQGEERVLEVAAFGSSI
jgi:hypothetical protein